MTVLVLLSWTLFDRSDSFCGTLFDSSGSSYMDSQLTGLSLFTCTMFDCFGSTKLEMVCISSLFLVGHCLTVLLTVLVLLSWTLFDCSRSS